MVDALIIGAGPAGLAAAACLDRAGSSYEIVEQADRVAPSWHRHYERLHLHTPKQHSALPFFPYPRDFPTYPSREHMTEYFTAYARAFDIVPRFEETVTTVERDGGEWVTQTDRDTYRSRAVIVATGLNAQPHVPVWPDREAYRGMILHSTDYRSGAAFRDRRVLVVGFGNSGGEIAVDLVEHGARVGIAVRSPVNIMPRDVLGLPLVSITLRLRHLPPWVLDAVSGPIQRLRIGDLSTYGLTKRPEGPATQIRRDARIPLIDIGTIGLIKSGAITVYPGVRRFNEDGVEFTDGRTAPFDGIVLATGFLPGLDFIRGVDLPGDTKQLPIHGASGPTPGLYFTGFRVTSTGTLREIGIEARNIARAVTAGPPAARRKR